MYQTKSFARTIIRTAVFMGLLFCIVSFPVSAQRNWQASGNIGVNWMGSDLNKGVILGFTPMAFGQINVDFLLKNFIFTKKFLWVKGAGAFFSAGYGRMYAENATGQRQSQNQFGNVGVGVAYRFLQNSPVNPLVFFKAGILFVSSVKYTGVQYPGYRPVSSLTCFEFGPGIGVEYSTKRIIYNVRAELVFPITDQLDGYSSGNHRDGTACLSAGVGIPF
jgi:hypothetical protein